MTVDALWWSAGSAVVTVLAAVWLAGEVWLWRVAGPPQRRRR